MQTNALRIDLLRKQNDSLKVSLETLSTTNNHDKDINSSTVPEEHYKKLRSQSKQEQSYHRHSYTNETQTIVSYQYDFNDKPL